MAKSLTETAKTILMKEEGIPSISSSDNNPDRDAKSSNSNKDSLKPKSKYSEKDPKKDESDHIADAPKKPGEGTNVGAAAAVKGKDTSIKSSVAAEASKKVPTEIKEEEEIELSEELIEFIDALVAEGLSEDEIVEAISENFELISEDEDQIEEEEEDYTVDMKEHVEALFAGEELSEEFKEKATTIFEAAVTSKVKSEVAKLHEEMVKEFNSKVESIQEQISNDVDDYLNYVVENWMAENEVAIEAGLRTELTEDFITSLRNVFMEHYIDIPEDKVSLIDEMSEKLEELETALNEEIEKNVAMNKLLSEAYRYEAIAEVSDDLTDTQAAKLRELAESIEFNNIDEYKEKLETLKENYFSTKVKNGNVLDKADSSENNKVLIESDDRMSKYMRALGKQTTIS